MAAPEPGPSSLYDCLVTVAWLPFGIALMAGSHLLGVPWVVRENEAGDPTDLPPWLPDEHIDGRTQTASAGYGPLFHRTFTATTRGSTIDAAALMDRLVADLDGPAPFDVVSFRKTLGRSGGLVEGDEYDVWMPAPWSGPVRAVHRDATSFRFATLTHHLEAGQIEFRAVDEGPGQVRVEIEAWSVAGDRWMRLLYADLPIGREVQLALWVQYVRATAKLAGGRLDGPVTAHTRRLDRPAERALDPAHT